MKDSNINEIINNALISQRKNNITKEKEIIKLFQQAIKENQLLIEKTTKMDLINNNSFDLDMNIINKIFNKYLNEEVLINENKDIAATKNNLLYSKVYEKVGIVLVLFDGNPYTLLELIILNILTHNTTIFSYGGYMIGTNGLLLTFIQSILEQNNYDKHMFQHSINISPEQYFENFKTINKTLIIGDNDFINKNLKICTTEVLISGYKNYDIYIDDNTETDLINKIINQKEEINVYINKELNLEISNAIYVNDIDEAITQINYNSSKYSTSIFTKDKENASKFIKYIKSKFVIVNTSPTLEQSLDINQQNLLKEKTILLPNIYKDNLIK